MTTGEAGLASEPGGHGVTTSIEQLAADLAAALMWRDRADTRDDGAGYVTAATDADAVRAEMAAIPARSKRDFALKLRSLGACPATAIPSLSMGERRLLASVIADARMLILAQTALAA
jgi:hypothetical protein